MVSRPLGPGVVVVRRGASVTTHMITTRVVAGGRMRRLLLLWRQRAGRRAGRRTSHVGRRTWRRRDAVVDRLVGLEGLVEVRGGHVGVLGEAAHAAGRTTVGRVVGAAGGVRRRRRVVLVILVVLIRLALLLVACVTKACQNESRVVEGTGLWPLTVTPVLSITLPPVPLPVPLPLPLTIALALATLFFLFLLLPVILKLLQPDRGRSCTRSGSS